MSRLLGAGHNKYRTTIFVESQRIDPLIANKIAKTAVGDRAAVSIGGAERQSALKLEPKISCQCT